MSLLLLALLLVLLPISAVGTEQAVDTDADVQSARLGTSIAVLEDAGGASDTDDQYVVFNVNDSGDDLVARESHTSGTTWASSDSIGDGVITKSAIWYGRWTPGVESSDVSVAWIDTASGRDDVYFNIWNIASESVNKQIYTSDITIYDGASCVAQNNNNSWISITVARSGRLYVKFWCDNSGERGFYYSDDRGASWSSLTDISTGDGDAPSQLYLLPGNTGDDNDVYAIYWDFTNAQISIQGYDASAGTWSSAADVDPSGASNDCQSVSWADAWPYRSMSAIDRPSDGYGVVCAWSETGATGATADLCCYECDTTSSTATASTCSLIGSGPALGDIAEQGLVSIALDEQTDDLYVFFVQGSWGNAVDVDYVYWNGSTWGSETTYSAHNDDIKALANSFVITDNGGAAGTAWYNEDLDDIYFQDTVVASISGASAPESLGPYTFEGTSCSADIGGDMGTGSLMSCDDPNSPIEGSEQLRAPDTVGTTQEAMFYAVAPNSDELWMKGCMRVNIESSATGTANLIWALDNNVHAGSVLVGMRLVYDNNNVGVLCNDLSTDTSANDIYTVGTTFQFTVYWKASTDQVTVNIDGVEAAACDGATAYNSVDGVWLRELVSGTSYIVLDDVIFSTSAEPSDRSACTPGGGGGPPQQVVKHPPSLPGILRDAFSNLRKVKTT